MRWVDRELRKAELGSNGKSSKGWGPGDSSDQ